MRRSVEIKSEKSDPKKDVYVTLDLFFVHGKEFKEKFSCYLELPVADKIALTKKKIEGILKILRPLHPDNKIFILMRECAIGKPSKNTLNTTITSSEKDLLVRQLKFHDKNLYIIPCISYVESDILYFRALVIRSKSLLEDSVVAVQGKENLMASDYDPALNHDLIKKPGDRLGKILDIDGVGSTLIHICRDFHHDTNSQPVKRHLILSNQTSIDGKGQLRGEVVVHCDGDRPPYFKGDCYVYHTPLVMDELELYQLSTDRAASFQAKERANYELANSYRAPEMKMPVTTLTYDYAEVYPPSCLVNVKHVSKDEEKIKNSPIMIIPFKKGTPVEKIAQDILKSLEGIPLTTLFSKIESRPQEIQTSEEAQSDSKNKEPFEL